MTTALSDQGIQFASGNIIDLRTSYPTTGTFTAGDIVFESSTAGRISGWKRLTTSANNVLGTDWLYFTELTLATSQATTSGTSIDFTGIPSWVKRVTVMLNGVSTSGASDILVRLGAGSVQTTGYTSYLSQVGAAGSTGVGTSSTAFICTTAISLVSVLYGQYVFDLIGANTWVGSFVGGGTDTTPNPVGRCGGGSVVLSGTLDRLRLTTVGGTDTFDAGSVNIMYEG